MGSDGRPAPGASAASESEAEAAGQCGVERWEIKTLTDPDAGDVHFRPRHTTIRHLRRLDRPSSVGHSSPRIAPHELRVYRVHGKLITAKLEEDSDFHLVVSVPKHRAKTMIVEFPARHCTAGAKHRSDMTRARRKFIEACGRPSSSSFTDLRGRAVLAGVGFWDFFHNQTGVAPNVFELHPVLSFKSANCLRK